MSICIMADFRLSCVLKSRRKKVMSELAIEICWYPRV